MSLGTYMACPYCTHNTPIEVKPEWYSTDIIRCDENDGGCGKLFIVRQSLEHKHEVFTLAEAEKEQSNRCKHNFNNNAVCTKCGYDPYGLPQDNEEIPY
jgi:hypothetical protein